MSAGALAVRFMLHTLPNQFSDGSADAWSVGELSDGFWLHGKRFARTRFPTLEKLWQALGAIHGWDRWTEDSKQTIEAYKGRPFFEDYIPPERR